MPVRICGSKLVHMNITVVGAGVIGLATAVALEEHGHTVQVVAAATGEQTTSSIAGAVWFPYRAGPRARVATWAARTHAWLLELARSDPSAGIDVLEAYEISDETAGTPWWVTKELDVARTAAPFAGAPTAWRFVAPRAEPAAFLPHLTARLRASIERRVVDDLAAEPGDVVVNCTGMGARALVRDPALVPLFGQIAIAMPGGYDRRVTVTDDRDPDAIFYAIPRREQLVLGGCARPHPVDAPIAVEPELTERILRQARALGLAFGDVVHERVGLRPYRAEVRLERDAVVRRIVHNYGHGGAGFTLCRGCAEEVVALVEG
jgi:D-amino-acid oxidase